MPLHEDVSKTGAAPSDADPADPRIERIVEILQDKKGLEITLLDLRKITDTSDYFLLCTGTSEQHVRSLAEDVREKLAATGETPWHIEGADTRRWVLLDYVDFVVHIFRQETRDFYALERLWGDAERTDFEDRWEPEEEEKISFEFSQF
jgi:ribosome-associated protein